MFYSPWGYEYSNPGIDRDGMSMQIGFANIFVLIIGLVLIIFSKKNRQNHLFVFLIFTSIAGIYLMSPSSIRIWQKILIIQQIQFPWRILMLTTFTTPIIFSYLIDNIKNIPIKLVFVFATVFLFSVNNRNYLRTWERIRYPDSRFFQNDLYFGSTDIAWEVKPQWVKISPYSKDIVTNNSENVEILKADEGFGTRARIYLDSTTTEKLTLNLFYWPAWIVKIDNNIVNYKINPKTGLMDIMVPKDSKVMSVEIGQTGIEKIANLISVVALTTSLLLIIVNKKINTKIANK
jgi:hypothetical protein